MIPTVLSVRVSTGTSKCFELYKIFGKTRPLFGSVKLAVDGELQQLAEEEDPRLSEAKAGAVKKILEVGGLEH
jgi:hypothetical protein